MRRRLFRRLFAAFNNSVCAAFVECRGNSAGPLPCTTRTEEASQLHAQGSCPGASNNGAGVGIGFHTVIAFSTACADIYHFRFHADYGRGGYIGVNDGAVGAFGTPPCLSFRRVVAAEVEFQTFPATTPAR